LKLRNLMEDAVFQAIEEALKRHNYCDCERCKLDIAALALNKLPTRYVVTDKGDSYARADLLELQNYLDILSTVIEAAKTVNRSPRHK